MCRPNPQSNAAVTTISLLLSIPRFLHRVQASFLEFAPAYFEHMARSMQSGRPTCLAKVCGVFNIAVRGGVGGGTSAAAGAGAGAPAGLFKDGSLDVLVMEHVFYDRQISRIYDLKGSERSRFNADAAANPQVGMHRQHWQQCDSYAL